ncbi:hypothetical protein GCM10011410_25690 [Hoyosella rhizosphaerae]|uniref:Uncharacterized protein n=1 Tax=Hoyosella rhizosphaerae TaxID=1755582 RepID=A0A916UGR9_9ACTN|nr:hypothetical protein GCM10011410_25690 [Hoyosella rhizosphaerae]
MATIRLDTPSPGASCGSPANSGEQPSNIRAAPPQGEAFCLAPDGVYLATLVTQGAGALLPHRFTLTHRGGRFVFCGTVPRVAPGCR